MTVYNKLWAQDSTTNRNVPSVADIVYVLLNPK